MLHRLPFLLSSFMYNALYRKSHLPEDLESALPSVAAVLLIHRVGSSKLHLECNKEFSKAVLSATVNSAAFLPMKCCFSFNLNIAVLVTTPPSR